MTVGGRLFQALVPAAEKDRSPSVDLRVAGTTNADELEDLRRCRDSNCATCCNCSERYAGARLCLHLNTRTHSLYWILSWIRSQWRSITHNDFVHICYILCDLLDCYIFNYEIMPATLANTFLFILQGSALADLRYGGRFYGTLCHS